MEFAVKQCMFIHDHKQTVKSGGKNQTLVALHTLQEQFLYDITILSPVKNFHTTRLTLSTIDPIVLVQKSILRTYSPAQNHRFEPK